MKVKFLLRPLIYPTSKLPDTTEQSSHMIESKSSLTTTTKREEAFEYLIEENKSKIIHLKQSITSQMKKPLDSLQLYLPNIMQQELYDGEELSICFNLNQVEISLMFYINPLQVKITVDFYQNNIEKLSIKLATTCTVYMVKYIINSKVSNDLLITNQKIYCIGLFNKSTQIKINTKTNKEFNDTEKLCEIISAYMNNMATISHRETRLTVEDCVVNFLLVKQINNKLQMGLNFKFNYFKSLSKISFDNTAPKYRECSDGINLFSYCRNNQCTIFNELFVIIIGYGCFDIIREAYRLECPKCFGKNNKINVKNIGLINSKWYYKGILNGKKQNIFEGDGITIDDKLYTLPEAHITELMSKLIIEAKPYKSVLQKAKTFGHSNGKVESNNVEDNDNDSLNSVCLYLPNEISISENNSKLKSFTPSLIKSDGLKIYENETDFNILDIQIDKEEELACKSCMNESFIPNGCIIF